MYKLACESSDFIMIDPWEVFCLQFPSFILLIFLKFQAATLWFFTVFLFIGCPLVTIYFVLFILMFFCNCNRYHIFKILLQASQSTYQRTLTILKRIESYFVDDKPQISKGKITGINIYEIFVYLKVLRHCLLFFKTSFI